MRLAVACLALLAIAASSRGGCGTPPHDYEPCAGKDCGAACTSCDPTDRACAETAIAKACAPGGACVPSGTFACPPATTDACAGKACGDACAIEPACRSATPPCMMPTLLGHCDAGGLCVAADPTCAPPPPPDPCAGKGCGDSCNPCGDANPCPTFAPTACDRSGRCVFAAPWLCYDPCAGKVCHEACSICPPGVAGCAAIMCVTSCDGEGRCTCSGSGAACP